MSAIKLRTAKAHPTEITRVGSKEKLVGHNGEINATDRHDMLVAAHQLLLATAAGEVSSPADREITASAAEIRQQVVAAYQDPTGRSFQELGAAIGTELYETANREGFMRRMLMRAEVVQGGIPRIPVSYKTSFAYQAASAAKIEPTYVRNKYVMPPEFYIQSHLWIEEREIFQSTGDILEQKLLEGQEAIMVREDKIWKRLADRVVGVSNPALTIVGGLTPQNLGLLRNQLLQWNLTTNTLLFASDLWTDITTNTSFGSFYDPVSQYEIIQTGVIGRLLGMTLVSDAYRVPQLKVLNRGELYIITSPEYHGGYTDRGPVVANEVNASAAGHGVPARGWHMHELLSMVIHNSRSLVKGTRT